METKGKTGVVVPPLTNIMASVSPASKPDEPVIPLSILDAPSQRAYALAVYALLFAWRLYDYSLLIKDDADSLFYFMKWVEHKDHGNGGPSWVNDHIDSWINISGCMLGAAKDIPAVLSGEMKDTVQINPAGAYGWSPSSHYTNAN